MSIEKNDCKSFTDFLINKITELKKTYRKQRNKRIDELQKENKELKDDNKVMADNYSRMEQKFFDNLMKAKELLKRYVPYRQITDSIAYKDLAEEAEQFLNSEV